MADRNTYTFDVMHVGDKRVIFEKGGNEKNKAVSAAKSYARYHGWKMKTETDITGDCVHITRIA